MPKNPRRDLHLLGTDIKVSELVSALASVRTWIVQAGGLPPEKLKRDLLKAIRRGYHVARGPADWTKDPVWTSLAIYCARTGQVCVASRKLPGRQYTGTLVWLWSFEGMTKQQAKAATRPKRDRYDWQLDVLKAIVDELRASGTVVRGSVTPRKLASGHPWGGWRVDLPTMTEHAWKQVFLPRLHQIFDEELVAQIL